MVKEIITYQPHKPTLLYKHVLAPSCLHLYIEYINPWCIINNAYTYQVYWNQSFPTFPEELHHLELDPDKDVMELHFALLNIMLI